MKRGPDKLENEEFDLLIVGGGIYGATTAREAALRGLKVALIERGDFGHATSANSLKIIHGGLRYLQHGDFRRMRRSIQARSTLLRIAPHLVNPLMFVMPTYGHFFKGREVMALALAVNEIVGWDRNRSLKKIKYIPKGYTISRKECLEGLPDIDKKGLTGGAVWYDCIANNTERLTLEFVIAAAQHGACVANYVEAKQPIFNGNSVIGVEARDCISKKTFQIRSKILVNAAGPWISNLLKFIPGNDCFNVCWAKAVNVFVKKSLFGQHAIGIAGRESVKDNGAIIKKDKRLIFCVPWQNGTIIGTTYNKYTDDPESFRVNARDILELLNEINYGYPPANLSFDDVSFYHAGLVPIANNKNSKRMNVQLIKRSRIYDHESESKIQGMITMNGVKYTTAIELAKDAVDLVFSKLGIKNHIQTRYSVLPGGEDISTRNENVIRGKWPFSIQSDTIKYLLKTYGSRYKLILNLIKKDRSLKTPIGKGYPNIRAEIVHAVRDEMAQNVSDVVMRRTNLGSTGNPGKSIITKCAEIMSHELGWKVERKKFEIDNALAAFKMPSD